MPGFTKENARELAAKGNARKAELRAQRAERAPSGPVNDVEARLQAALQPPPVQAPRQPDQDASDRRVPERIVREMGVGEDELLAAPGAYHLDDDDMEFMMLPGHNEQAKVRTHDDVSRHGAVREDVRGGVAGVAIDWNGPQPVVLYTNAGDPFLVAAQNARAVLRTGDAHYRCPWCHDRHAEFDATGHLIQNPNACPERPARKGIRCGVCGKVMYDTPPSGQDPTRTFAADPNIIEDAHISNLTPEQRLYAMRDEHYAAFHPAEARAKGIDVDAINRRELESARTVGAVLAPAVAA